MDTATPTARTIGRRLAIAGATALGFAAGAVGVAFADHGADDAVEPTSTVAASTSSVASSSSTNAPTTVAATPSIAPTTVVLTIPAPSNTVTVPSTSSPSTSSPSTSSPSTSSPSTSSPSTSSPSTSSPSTSSPSTSAAPAALAPFSDTFSSAGGSVSVSWNGSTLSLDAVNPASGFSAEVKDAGGDRVRVDFEGADDEFRVEVRVEDGRLRVRTD